MFSRREDSVNLRPASTFVLASVLCVAAYYLAGEILPDRIEDRPIKELIKRNYELDSKDYFYKP